MPSVLSISNLHASAEGKDILRGINLTVRSGEVHAVMGPNGSGKSTLAAVLMGSPAYEVKSKKSKVKGAITIDDEDVLSDKTEERAKKGLFLAFQSPIAIPGVTVLHLLRTAYEELHGKKPGQAKGIQNPVLARRFNVGSMTIGQFTDLVKKHAKELHLEESLLNRGIHDGFSGGERKKAEMLQALVLKPRFAVFDEIDTGLDVDALQSVAQGIALLKQQGAGIIIITHYQRILKYVETDYVHVMVGGKIVKSGDSGLAGEIEKYGYKSYLH